MWLGILALLLAGFIGGQSPILIKIGLREFPPIFLTTFRFLLATIIFLPFYLRQKQTLSRKDIRTLFTQSVFFALNVGLFSIAIQFTTAIISQILYTLVPIIVIFLSYFLLKEKLTSNKIIGLILAMAGVSFLIQQSVVKTDVLTFGTPLGNFLNLGAVFSWSLYMVFSKNLTNKYSSATTSFFSFLVTTLLLFLIVPFEQFFRPLLVNKITIIGLSSVFGLAVFSSALMFFLIQFSIKRTTPFTASFYQYLGPFSAAITAIPFLGEKPTLSLVIGGILIMVGVFWATSYRYARKYLRSVLK